MRDSNSVLAIDQRRKRQNCSITITNDRNDRSIINQIRVWGKMLTIVLGITIEVHQLTMKPTQHSYFSCVELTSLVQRLELDLLSRKSTVVEWRLDGSQVMCTNCDKRTTTTDVEVELILQIKETNNQF